MTLISFFASNQISNNYLFLLFYKAIAYSMRSDLHMDQPTVKVIAVG